MLTRKTCFLPLFLLVSCTAYDARLSDTADSENGTSRENAEAVVFRPQAPSGSCLRADSAGAVAVPALGMDCRASDSNNLWAFDGNRLSASGGACLTTQATENANTTSLILRACSTKDANQLFSFRDGQMRAESGTGCLDANVLNTTPLPLPHLLSCEPNVLTQLWAFEAAESVTPTTIATATEPQLYLTTADLKQKLSLVPSADANGFVADVSLSLDTNQRFQKMVGGGASLTDSSSFLLASKVSEANRATVLEQLFHPTKGIGLVMLRQPMGASDFSSVGNYSFDEMPSGQTDLTLAHFNLTQDMKATIPLLKQIQALAPDLFVLGTPWSPPGWMKTNNTMDGGGAGQGFAGLNVNDYQVLADYFVKFVQQYQAAGVSVRAVTPQNEPLFDSSGYPGMSLTAPYAAQLIANNLGPALKAAKLPTQIWGYDHNWDRPDYPEALASDANAAPWLGGMAYHCYAGDPAVMSAFHTKYPAIDIHMTECSGGSWQSNPFGMTLDVILQSTLNWAKSVTLWNLVLDSNNGPQNRGCSQCRGLVTVDATSGAVAYTTDFYAMGHFTKFVRPNAQRIGVTALNSSALLSVAFENTNGQKVVICHNTSNAPLRVLVTAGDRTQRVQLPANAAATLTF